MHTKSFFAPRYLRAATLALFLVTMLLGSGTAQAHKVNVFAYVEGGQIKGEGYFPGGDKARDSLVELLDGGGQLLTSTRTDQEGQFTLDVPAKAQPPLKVVIKASMGHQGDYTMGWGDRRSVDPAPAQEQALQGGAGTPAGTPAPAVNNQELEERLGRLIDQRLEPLKAQLARLDADRGVTVHDVVAGLGYILGLFGLAAYFKSRR